MERTATLHESALPLLPGESANDFMSSVMDALRVHYAKTFGIGYLGDDNRTGWVWTRDVYADHVVVEVEPKGMPCRYERVPMGRAANGTFAFGEVMQVRPVRSWVPIAATKDAAGAVLPPTVEVRDTGCKVDQVETVHAKTRDGRSVAIEIRRGDGASVLEAAERLVHLRTGGLLEAGAYGDAAARLYAAADATVLRRGSNENTRAATTAHAALRAHAA